MQSKSTSKDDPQMAILLRAGLGQRPDPVMSFGYPIGEAKTQELGSFSAAFPDVSAGSWCGNGATRSQSALSYGMLGVNRRRPNTQSHNAST